MATILAGHFELQDEVKRARSELVDAGFPEDHICGFFVSQAGQHNRTPLGGDHLVSPGAKETGRGVLAGEVTGGAVGAALGAATAPVTGPLGVLVGGAVGAHVGSLYSFHRMKEPGEPEQHTDGDPRTNAEEPRHAGMMLAVEVEGQDEEDRALALLRRLGAQDIERAEGHIEDGDWSDFDPLRPAQPLH